MSTKVRKQFFNRLEYVNKAYEEYVSMFNKIRFLKHKLKQILSNSKITFLMKHTKTGITLKVAVYIYHRAGKQDKRIRIVRASNWDLKNFKENTALAFETRQLISEIYDLQEKLKQHQLQHGIYTYRLGKKMRGIKK